MIDQSQFYRCSCTCACSGYQVILPCGLGMTLKLNCHFTISLMSLFIAYQIWRYCMVGNFHEGFIFAFFENQEAISKTAKFSLSTCTAILVQLYFNLSSCPNSNRSQSVSVPLMDIVKSIRKLKSTIVRYKTE